MMRFLKGNYLGVPRVSGLMFDILLRHLVFQVVIDLISYLSF